jgi:hypothetical protein
VTPIFTFEDDNGTQRITGLVPPPDGGSIEITWRSFDGETVRHERFYDRDAFYDLDATYAWGRRSR